MKVSCYSLFPELVRQCTIRSWKVPGYSSISGGSEPLTTSHGICFPWNTSGVFVTCGASETWMEKRSVCCFCKRCSTSMDWFYPRAMRLPCIRKISSEDSNNNNGQLAAVVLTTVLSLLIGFLLGYYASRNPTELENQIKLVNALITDGFTEGDEKLENVLNDVSAQRLRENLEGLSEIPHLAGSKRDDVLAKHIHNRWKRSGFDSVEMVGYDVLVSHPDLTKPNKILLVDEAGEEIFATSDREENPPPGNPTPHFIPAYSGYSPSGNVTADLVYVNYGTSADFHRLRRLHVAGTICIARYGYIPAWEKVQNAQKRGAVGVILFTDPTWTATAGHWKDKVFPRTWWLPPSGIRRDIVREGFGDPLTPGWPSIDGAYKLEYEEANFPKIPCQPIGYGDATMLLKFLKGRKMPSAWRPGLPGISFRIGPGFDNSTAARNVKILVNNKLEKIKSYNVIGRINGRLEPDRYVLLGNHRDSWGYGAIDPSSGTSQMLETARVLGQLKKKGWRPRRTIVFCSWGAKEFGMIGSTEWVEDKLPKLMERAVAYINCDICVSGNLFRPTASPLLQETIWRTAKMIPDPFDSSRSLFDTWSANSSRAHGSTYPRIDTPESESDYIPFMYYAGIPSADVWFKTNKTFNISIFPTYHTAYDTFEMMTKFVDPDFKLHATCSKVTSIMLLLLADSALLPFNLEEYGSSVREKLKAFDANGAADILERNGLWLDKLHETLANFSDTARRFHRKLSNMDIKNPMVIRMLNDQMMKIERLFILPAGLPRREETRHVVFGKSKYVAYHRFGFPGLSDLIHDVDSLKDAEKDRRWKEIKRHLSDIMVVVHQATDFLRPPEEL